MKFNSFTVSIQFSFYRVCIKGFIKDICKTSFSLVSKNFCPILTSEGDVRTRRMVLARQAGDTLKQGLALLGIEVVSQM